MSSSQPSRKTRQWILQSHPTGEVNLESTFKLVEKNLRELVHDEVLVKTLYISNDPAQRVWIAGDESPRLYVPPVRVGDVMRASLIGEVIDSKSATIPSGSLIKAVAGWTELSIQPASKCTLIPHNLKLSPTHYLGALGTTGVTAYYGLVEVAHATPDDIVLVSGAAGATGSMAIQVAKNVIGCKKVIGIAGSEKKCRWVEKLGADHCVNYKSPTYEDDLRKVTQDSVSLFFDNVGGDIFDTALPQMAMYGRVALCGAISKYNSSSGTIFHHFEEVITYRLKILGFVAFDYLDQYPKVFEMYKTAAEEGKILLDDSMETIVPASFEEIPQVWSTIYKGSNQGKLITRI